MGNNLEAAADHYAREQSRKYVEKRGGAAPVQAAFDVYMWAFNRFMANPDEIQAVKILRSDRQ